MTPQEFRSIARRGDVTSEELRGALAQAADELEGLERGRLELAILEPSLMPAKEAERGDLIRFSFGMLYEDSPEVKLGQVTRGFLGTRVEGGKLIISPPITKTGYGRKFCPFVLTQATHDLLVDRIEASPWAKYIGSRGVKGSVEKGGKPVPVEEVMAREEQA